MKAFLSKAANAGLTFVAKKFVKTGCLIFCHRPEAPEELFKA
ncbi:cyclic lactone autoinducer peptide [Paenibacillus sp. MBLB4367]